MKAPFQNDDPHYRGMVDPITADKRNRVVPAYGIKRKVIKLDAALVDEPVGIRGDFLYVDNNSTGVAVVRLNSTSEDPFPLLAQAGVRRIPYEGVFLTADAQPGLVLNLWYGYGAEFIAPAQNIATIGSITNPVKISDSAGNAVDTLSALEAIALADRRLIVADGGYAPGVMYTSVTNLAAVTAQTILAAGSNINGYVAHRLQAELIAAAGSRGDFTARATPPANVGEGNVLQTFFYSAAYSPSPQPVVNTRIPSGLGLDIIGSLATTAAIISAHYTLF